MSQDEQDELQRKYDFFKVKVKSLLDTQGMYFKTRDKKYLIASKNIQKELMNIIEPKAKEQQSLYEWLAQ